MKHLALLTALLTALCPAQEPEAPVVLMPWKPAAREVPLFYSATATVRAVAGLGHVTTEQQLVFRIHQGKPERLSVALAAAGEVVAVHGEGLGDWAVRVAAGGGRFLDLRPVLPEDKDAAMPKDFAVTVQTKQPVTDGAALLCLPGQGPATGFELDLRIGHDPAASIRVLQASGLVPVAGQDDMTFMGRGEASLQLGVQPAGLAAAGIELTNTTLRGRLAPDGNSVAFTLTSAAKTPTDNARIPLCAGAALASGVAGDGWHLALGNTPQGPVYELVADRAGDFALQAEFIVPVTRKGDWRQLAFRLTGGVVVPITLGGLPAAVEFDRSLSVVPEKARDQPDWIGFLPAGGEAAVAWRATDAVSDGALFFSSTETTDIRVGSGLLRQMTVTDLRVLQGRLPALDYSLTGSNEILAVTGDGVLGWSVTGAADARKLQVRFSQPLTGTGRLVIESQAALGAFPARALALRATPDGSLRHSGWLRLANEGAVRIEPTDATGLIQLAPAQFPGGVDPALRQVFVYRFPSAEHSFAIQADQITPEISVVEKTTYEIAEVDRRIIAAIQLDIREAPVREWELEIPAGFAVAELSGAAVADYVLVGGATGTAQRVRVGFAKEVSGVQLINLRLEQNLAAKPGPWTLPKLQFPGAKSRRGLAGVVATAGFRVAVAKTTGVAELPLTSFGQQVDGLQQAFRLREENWDIHLNLEALGQSIQADVFHLYTLGSGVARGSVLINYFVVGAPATEWRIAVPEGLEKVEIIGQNVGRDWRMEDRTLIAPLSRPVAGSGTALVTFEQVMDPRGAALSPGLVQPLGVQGERGFVQVVSPLQVRYSVAGTEGPLLEIDASELPPDYRVLTSAPTIKAWQYTGRDFRIDSRVEWFEPADTAGQVVDFLNLTSKISRDGEWSTDVRAYLKYRLGNTLRLTLPPKTTLWEVRVDGQAVNARQDGAHTLVPLPPGADPKRAVEVAMRYGDRAPRPSAVTLTAPKLDAPVVIGQWTVTGDEGRTLVPRGGNADLVHSSAPRPGYAWLARRTAPAVILTLAAALAALLLGRGAVGRTRLSLALACGLATTGLAVALTIAALGSATGSSGGLAYAAPVVFNGAVSVEVANLPDWRAGLDFWVWVIGLIGLALLVGGLITRNRDRRVAGAAVLACSFLFVGGGAPLFFGFAALVALLWCIRRIRELLRLRAANPTSPASPAAPAAAVMLALAFALPAADRAGAAPADPPAPNAAELMNHDWHIADGRLRGTVEVVARGKAGDRFLLLTAPAVLSSFHGEGLKVVKGAAGDSAGYYLILEGDGRFSGTAEFAMPLPDPAKGWQLPAGGAAMRQVTVRWNRAGWEFASPSAARVQPLAGLPATSSGAILTLNTDAAVTIKAVPRQRDVTAEETRFFAEVANLYLPLPGVLNGRHRVAIRPAQGLVPALVLIVPEGLTVSDVTKGPVDNWRFDPEKRELRVVLSPAQSAPFELLVETQRGTGALPVALELAPLRVTGSAGDLGFVGIACADDAQVAAVEPTGLSRVRAEDFGTKLLPKSADGVALATLQHAYRYGAGEALAKARIAALTPELRAENQQRVTLGDDRLTLEAALTIHITRAGVFRLRVRLPEGLEIESATGDGLAHWAEGKDDGGRVLTLHLQEKSIGTRKFNLVLTGPAPAAAESWTVPAVRSLDTSRESGLLAVVPDSGTRIRTAERRSASPIEASGILEAVKSTAIKTIKDGTLAYRLLQADWSVALAISKLDPWVTTRVFHDATLREGQLLSRVAVACQVENAPIKTLRVTIPGLDANAASTVRASGANIAEITPVGDDHKVWEIRFQGGILTSSRDGTNRDATFELQFQRRAAEQGDEVLEPITFEGTQTGAYFAALRTGGRLEVRPGATPRGWQRTDWPAVQTTLKGLAGASAPLWVFRVTDPDGPLPVVVRRLDLTDTQRLRVAEGTLTTLLAPDGNAITAVDLRMEVAAKSPLVLTLPADATPFSVRVNEVPVNLVRADGGWQFHLLPPMDGSPGARVEFVFSAPAAALRLEGPGLSVPTEKQPRGVPMENLTWHVLLPDGWSLRDFSGDFLLRGREHLGSFGVETYLATASSRQQAEKERARSWFDTAEANLRAGKQERANWALNNALLSNSLDEATNDDARELVFRNLTEQAVMGINTRRQRLQLDNRAAMSAAANDRLDRAAAANPLMQGKLEYQPQQAEQALESNSAEERSAMDAIAARLVDQQLADDAAPQALDPTLPRRGQVVTFARSIQVADPGHRMALTLDLKRDTRASAWLAALLCLALGLLAGDRRPAPRPAAAN